MTEAEFNALRTSASAAVNTLAGKYGIQAAIMMLLSECCGRAEDEGLAEWIRDQLRNAIAECPIRCRPN